MNDRSATVGTADGPARSAIPHRSGARAGTTRHDRLGLIAEGPDRMRCRDHGPGGRAHGVGRGSAALGEGLEIDRPDLAGIPGLGPDERRGDDPTGEALDDGGLPGVEAAPDDPDTVTDGEIGSPDGGRAIDGDDVRSDVTRFRTRARSLGGRRIPGLRVRHLALACWHLGYRSSLVCSPTGPPLADTADSIAHQGTPRLTGRSDATSGQRWDRRFTSVDILPS